MLLLATSALHTINRHFSFRISKNKKQAGAELGQAQLKLGLDFNQIKYKFGFSLFDLVEFGIF